MAKQWTVMVYMAGDNNLSEEMIYAIKEMYRVGVTKEFDVTVQFDPSGIGPRVRRYDIGESKNKDSVIANAARKRGIEQGKNRKKVDIDGQLEELRDKEFE